MLVLPRAHVKIWDVCERQHCFARGSFVCGETPRGPSEKKSQQRLSSGASPFRVLGWCSSPVGSQTFARRFLRSACKCSFTRLPLRKRGWLGDTCVDVQHRSGAQFFGRLRQRGPGPDLSLGACLSRLKQRRPLTSALGTRAAMNFSSRRTIRASRLLRSRLRLCDC